MARGKKSEIEEFTKGEWVTITAGTTSKGIMQKRVTFDGNVKGQVVTQDKSAGYILVEVPDKHMLIDYSPTSLVKNKPEASYNQK